MSIGLNQSIIMPLYKINSECNVMKWQHVVLLLCLFVGSDIIYYNDNYDVCVSPYSTLSWDDFD